MSTTADLVIRGGKVVVAGLASSTPASRSRTASSSRSAPTQRCRRRARRSTRAASTCCPAPSTCTCTSAIPAIRTRRISRPAPRRRHSAASPPCSTCRTPSRRPAPPRCWPPSTASRPRRRMSISASMGLLGEDTIEHVPALVDGGVIGFKLYMGNTFGKIPSPVDRRDAGSLRGGRADRQARLAACRDQFDHGAARDPHAQRRPARSARASRLAPGGGRGRGREPRRDPGGMDRRPHPHPAHFLGRGVAARCAKPRRAASTSPARPARNICCSRPTTMPASAASSGSIRRCARRRNQEPLWAALADGTVDMIATDHAPHAPAEKTRNDIWTVDCGFPGRRDADAADADRGRCRAHEHLRLRALERGQSREDLGPVSAQGRDPAGRRRRHRARRSRPRMDDRRRQAAVALQDHALAWPAGVRACRSTRWCAAAS